MFCFSDITIVNIDGRVHDYELALNALVHSQSQLPGAKGLLLSPKCPENLPACIEHKSIPLLGYLEYSIFVTHLLHQFIETEFALIVQDDGWVIDGRNWQTEFFSYDYIGAPSHAARVVVKGEQTVYARHYRWVSLLNNRDVKIDIVLNGGFSLRSQKLMSAPSKFNVPFQLDSIALFQLEHLSSIVSLKDDHQEDVQLCINMRSVLESMGIKFAPIEMARLFSLEHLDTVIHQDLNLCKIFGHHSKLRKLKSLHPLTIEYPVNEGILVNMPGEMDVVKLFKLRDYVVNFDV
jgi:hypothetical protein